MISLPIQEGASDMTDSKFQPVDTNVAKKVNKTAAKVQQKATKMFPCGKI